MINKSYFKLNKNRISKFQNKNNSEVVKINEDEFFELETVNTGSSFSAKLIYHIEKEKLLLVKESILNSSEGFGLIVREKENYKQIKHPFIPSFYGITKDANNIIIEFINGKSLYEICLLNEFEQITIIFEIMLAIEYLHLNNFVYRDLKPNNIIIDENKIAVLIDFDRMNKYNKNSMLSNEYTLDFQSEFAAPEVNTGNISFKNDIYSLGKLFKYVINKPNQNKLKEYPELEKIVDRCTKLDVDERPSITELIIEFVINYYSQIQAQNIYELYKRYFNDLYDSFLINEIQLILTEKNIGNIQYHIAEIYFGNHGIPQDIKKALYYYDQASKQNNAEAQYKLGVIFYEGEIISRDIKKAIYYLTLAANQNISNAQYILGLTYFDRTFITADIQKAIYYFTLAAKQNHLEASLHLGNIYCTDRYFKRDINKAIYYLIVICKSQLFSGTIFTWPFVL